MSLNNIKRVYVNSDEDTIWISKSIMYKMLDEALDDREVTITLELNLSKIVSNHVRIE